MLALQFPGDLHVHLLRGHVEEVPRYAETDFGDVEAHADAANRNGQMGGGLAKRAPGARFAPKMET